MEGEAQKLALISAYIEYAVGWAVLLSEKGKNSLLPAGMDTAAASYSHQVLGNLDAFLHGSLHQAVPRNLDQHLSQQRHIGIFNSIL
jgi:hypothetical protein